MIARRKSVTADSVEDYERGYGVLGDGGYAAGDFIEVFDLKGGPHCVLHDGFGLKTPHFELVDVLQA